MTPRSPSAILLSATLHGLFVAIALLLAYAMQSQVKDQPKVFELVAGEGDNYAATEAPALGVSGGIRIALPEPTPIPAPPAPAPVAPPPIEAAPEPVVTKAPVEKPVPATPKPVETKAPDFSKQIKRTIIRKESQVKQQIKKEREAEAKRLSKEEFDRQNRAARVAAAGGNPKVKRIDSEGIAGGVIGGSTANKTGGAGGKALTRDEGDLMDAYFSLVKRKMKDALDKPPGLSDTLAAVAEFHLAADGSISGVHISRSSGSEEFDRAVLEAVRSYRSIGARPDHKSETVNLTFKMKEEDDS